MLFRPYVRVVLLTATHTAHQIRVHLQYLGHPIANDPIYSDARIWVRSSPVFLPLPVPVFKLHHAQGNNLGKGGIDLVPSEERDAPQAPSQFQFDASNNPEAITSRTEGASAPPPTENAANEPTERKLLPRETGHDIGMGSPVPLSAEAVGIITRLRNMKVSCCRGVCYSAHMKLRRSCFTG